MTVLALFALFACGGPSPADLVVYGTILPEGQGERAVIVHEGRVKAIVSAAEAPRHQGPSTRVLRADRVTAGFVDAHAHPLGLGRQLSELDLRGAATYAAALERVRSAPHGPGWLTGRGWDQNPWADAPEGGWPRAVDLDAVTGDRPAVLRRVDGHAAWVNSAALRASGITAETPDPPGGLIVRDAEGAPTGVLVDNAVDRLVTPPIPAETQAAWARAAQRRMIEVGLTGAHVMGASDAEIALWQSLDREGALAVRLWIYAEPTSAAAERLRATGPYGEGRVRVVGVKWLADGALGSRGARLLAPYVDQPEHLGLVISDRDALAREAVALSKTGSQLAIHAIGDAAVRDALDALEAAHRASPDPRVGGRVEHAQVVDPADLPRFAALGVYASVQPTHATSDMPWAEARLGPERVRNAYAWRALRDAGAVLPLGSDMPVEAPDPAAGLWAATTRTDTQGRPDGGWMADQALTLEEAILGFTAWPARAVGEADHLGGLREGARADLSVWTVEAGPGGRERWAPAATVVDGKVVWERSAPR
jgi:predicted amidohydrolase YtcJ